MAIWKLNKVIFETTIGTDAQRVSKITVHELDDVVEVATRFAEQHYLN